MTLENLLRIGRIKEHPPDADEIQKLLAAARRSLKDARVQVISQELRFDAAYKAIMQTALVALMANGYRPDTNQPGHHMTVLQSLPKTMGLPGVRLAVLDTLRRKRNLADYTGEDIDEGSVKQCVKEAERLQEDVTAWLTVFHTELTR
jgi:uncharacterized protein (UPF0332 family)